MSLFSSEAFQGETILITGATGGIGSATAKTLLSLGAKVLLTGRNLEKLSYLERTLKREYHDREIYSFACDLGSEEEREKLLDFVQSEVGTVTMLVNNAGVYEYGTVEELNEESLNRIMSINFTSTVLLTQKIYEQMKERKQGAIVNVASLSGLRGNFGNTAYVSSKFALIGFTHCIALEAIQYGIRVNAVCPGFVDTDMGKAVIQTKGTDQSFTEKRRIVESNIPSGRITTPTEVANSIAFLLSDASRNIIGESLKISGGVVLR
ncbi:SDR family NAD(P)-dependent oxidoreductase [Bacillus niameyensis]|uniref:SDR family NAD(P)-dependent oxidoreductase n=1 Tax=Bacillus niameyensis TaxID=1522308 RepID=UPI0007847E27|nr:SDR family oxidoreductase [Bacillus niameyensis]